MPNSVGVHVLIPDDAKYEQSPCSHGHVLMQYAYVLLVVSLQDLFLHDLDRMTMNPLQLAQLKHSFVLSVARATDLFSFTFS